MTPPTTSPPRRQLRRSHSDSFAFLRATRARACGAQFLRRPAFPLLCRAGLTARLWQTHCLEHFSLFPPFFGPGTPKKQNTSVPASLCRLPMRLASAGCPLVSGPCETQCSNPGPDLPRPASPRRPQPSTAPAARPPACLAFVCATCANKPGPSQRQGVGERRGRQAPHVVRCAWQEHRPLLKTAAPLAASAPPALRMMPRCLLSRPAPPTIAPPAPPPRRGPARGPCHRQRGRAAAGAVNPDRVLPPAPLYRGPPPPPPPPPPPRRPRHRGGR